MLQDIYIKNFALIKQLELTPQNGATMITGETGAGKSIILGAIDLALGGRANAQLISQGEKSAEISLQFNINKLDNAKAWLKKQELGTDNDNDCIIRRTISKDGKSRCYINGTPSTVQHVKQLATLLVNIHGQHENQSLMKPATQMAIVDSFANNHKLLSELQQSYEQWKLTNNEYTLLQGELLTSEQRTAFLKFQLDEFEQANLNTKEITNLPQQHKQLAHAQELIQHYQHTTHLLRDDEKHNVCHTLNKLQDLCGSIGLHDHAIKDTHELINGALLQCEEAYNNIQQLQQNINCDPTQLAHIEQRMSTVHTLARKHRVKAEQLPELYQTMKTEYNSISNIDNQLEILQTKLQQFTLQYKTTADKLSKRRKQTAKQLNQLITEQINQLGMPKAEFTICVHAHKQEKPSQFGHEHIEFQIMTNPGNPAQAMTKIASGGELSRISLAIQVTTAKHIDIPTLIFDEVDVGIGGATAAVVGKLLHQLGNSHQIICITHQPQVAAYADHHWHVEKLTGDKKTDIGIFALNKKQRIDELARMLGGIKITKQTKAHAKEMLELHITPPT